MILFAETHLGLSGGSTSGWSHLLRMPPSMKYLREDVYTFESWSTWNYHFQHVPRNKAVVDVLWDKYILTLAVISLVNSTIDRACRCIYTYDVGLCHCSFQDMGCGRPRLTGASKYSRPRLFCTITKAESGVTGGKCNING